MISKPVGAGADAGPKVADEKLFVTMTESQLEMEVRVRLWLVCRVEGPFLPLAHVNIATPPAAFDGLARATPVSNGHSVRAPASIKHLYFRCGM